MNNNDLLGQEIKALFPLGKKSLSQKSSFVRKKNSATNLNGFLFSDVAFPQANQMAGKVAASGILHTVEIRLKTDSGALFSYAYLVGHAMHRYEQLSLHLD